MIKHIINSFCMKGMTCQISSDSWLAILILLQKNTSAEIQKLSFQISQNMSAVIPLILPSKHPWNPSWFIYFSAAAFQVLKQH